MATLPALSLIASPSKRQVLLDLAAQAERSGFAGLAVSGVAGNLALCGSLAHVTSKISFWTSIQPIYLSNPSEVAATAGHLNEVSNGRFRLGLGVSHAPTLDRIGLVAGKPLSDIRNYVAAIRAAQRSNEVMPPILLATLRDRMLDLAVRSPTARCGPTPRWPTHRPSWPASQLSGAARCSWPRWCRP